VISGFCQFKTYKESEVARTSGDESDCVRNGTGTAENAEDSRSAARITESKLRGYEKLECRSRKWENNRNNLSVARAKCAFKEVSMLATRHRLPRNPLFQFHPMHTVFSFLGALILFGLLVWFLAIPAK